MKQVNIYITLWALFFLISPAAISFENHHNGKHQTISTINSSDLKEKLSSHKQRNLT